MKFVLIIILSGSLSSQVMALETSVSRSAAPSSDQSINSSMNEAEISYSQNDYNTTDSVQTGQSATKREYQDDAFFNSCRSMNGVWLSVGDKGYSKCMENSQTLKK